MKKYLNRIALGAGTVGIIIAGAAAFSAFEAHVINVTAKIENALDVPVKALDFGTVFPQEALDQQFNVYLSESFLDASEIGTTNLVLNGSFENPEVDNPAKWQLFADGTADLVWSVAWVDPAQNAPVPALQEYHEGVNGWLAQHGDQYAELDSDYDGPGGPLNGEKALTKISQDIPTEAGKKYQLSFYFSPRPGTPLADNSMTVNWDGNFVATVTGDGTGKTQTDWKLYSYTVTATDSSSKLEFVGGGTNNSLGVFLDNISVYGLGRVSEVDYVIRQKPKCILKEGIIDLQLPPFGIVKHDEQGNFSCEDGEHYQMMPLLCPYLSKEEVTTDGQGQNDGPKLDAFHGLPGLWNLATAKLYEVWGRLSVPQGDVSDTWNIDLKVPCFEGQCAQEADDPQNGYSDGIPGFYVPEDYRPPAVLNSELFGCDLWLEVTGINQPPQ